MTKQTNSEFWKNILRATEAEPHEARAIQGASGFSHPVVAIGVDNVRRRVVMISGEGDARAAALAQGDVQASMPSVRVVMARPAAVNLAVFAQFVTGLFGHLVVSNADLKWMGENQEEVNAQLNKHLEQHFKNMPKVISSIDLNFVGLFKDVVQQLSLIEIERKETGAEEAESRKLPNLDLSKLAVLDPAEADRRLGVCTIPIYEFSPDELEGLLTSGCTERAKDVLRRMDVLQYFFPAADQLALGLADRELLSPDAVLERVTRVPELGHPFGPTEVIDSSIHLRDTIAALQDRGLIIEGEVGLELSSKAEVLRAQVRFKPRESIFAKISKVFSAKIDFSLKDLKDLFK